MTPINTTPMPMQMPTQVDLGKLTVFALENRMYAALRGADDRRLPEAHRLAKLRFAESAWQELLRRRRARSSGEPSQ